MFSISVFDWSIIAIYLIGLIAMAWWLSRSQFSREDYYVGDRSLGSWPIAISIMATQCSTNSILGAPAFVAFAVEGGLQWLQYELAVPLAMIPLMLVFLPMFRKLRLVTVYQYLEKRFDLNTRLILSGLFMFVRAFATAVTVYSIAIVIDLITGIGFFWSVILLGLFTVVYDVLGGIKGVIYSDVIQLLILVSVLLLLTLLLTESAGGLTDLLNQFPAKRRMAVDFSHHGFGDGNTFSFWPMLFGGFFLYVSYYGCDQSQVQRELCAKDLDTGNRALFANGVLRFPLVALYCLVGVGIAVHAQNAPSFLSSLPGSNGGPNFNLAVPVYMIQQLPQGFVGLGLVALFAAAMSSLDSVLNSLSATTMEDYVRRFRGQPLSDVQELWISRLLTVFWGALTLSLAFYVEDIAPTVLESINKIGSLINGPILGVFTLGIFTRVCHSGGAIFGLMSGFLVNTLLWLLAPQISWLWWNVLGFVMTFVSGILLSILWGKAPLSNHDVIWTATSYQSFGFASDWIKASGLLVLWFIALLTGLVYLTFEGYMTN